MRKLKNFLRNIFERFVGKGAKRIDCKMSFSQNGEDILLKILLFDILKMSQISYLDIGANDPRRFSNTYLFYTMFADKSKGMLIEPNPELCEKIRMVRKRDIVLQAGIVGKETDNKMVYYMMSDNTLNSFSETEMENYKAQGYKLMKEVMIDVVGVNTVLERYGKCNLLSIDVEGLDFDILKNLNYDLYAPEVICVENCRHNSVKHSDTDIDKLLKEKGYTVFADTHVNTIFVLKVLYDNALN